MRQLMSIRFIKFNESNRLCSPNLRWITSTSELPVITLPIPLKATLKKVLKKQKEKAHKERLRLSRFGNQTVPIITSKREELNHYKGQTYDKFKPLPLCTKGWNNRRSKGDYFIVNGFDSNPALQTKSENENCADFLSFGLSSEILAGLDSYGIKIPTNIQSLAIPHMLNNKNVICAAETGSGKTLAYLAPIINNILQFKSTEQELPYNSPLGLIIAPGRELVHQIANVAKKLTRDIPFKTTTVVGGGMQSNLMYYPPTHNVDLMVATLGTLKKLIFTNVYNVKLVQHLVIDEADTMLDDSFSESLITFLRRFRFRQNFLPPSENVNCTQLCLVGATLPRDLVRTLNPVIDVETMEKITTNYLHRIMPHVPQKFLRTISSEKSVELLKLIKNDLKKKKPVMIFCKNRKTSDYVHIFLKENGVESINLDGGMLPKFRHGQFDKFQNGDVDVITCTDIGSRGLDTTRVHHVINFDFPHFVSDYIHRAGRTGRVGSNVTGHVTSFVCKEPEVHLVQKIETSIRKTDTLPNVNANIKRKLTGDDVSLSEYI